MDETAFPERLGHDTVLPTAARTTHQSDIAQEAIILFILAGSTLLFFILRHRRYQAPLPPGPIRLSLIGNLLDHPHLRPFEKYHEWSKEYSSDVIYLNISGVPIVVLNSYRAMIDLLKRRAKRFSSRPHLPMVDKLTGWGFHWGFMAYGPKWQAHRALMHQTFHKEASKHLRPLQLEAAHDLLSNLLLQPEDFKDHLRRMIATILMPTTYGVALADTSYAWQECFPALRRVMSWVPASILPNRQKHYMHTPGQVEGLMVDAKRRMDSGDVPPCFVSHNLSTASARSMHYNTVQNVAGSIFSASYGATATTLDTFIFAMAIHPYFQRKAQQELDSLLSPIGFPSFDHQDKLPYVTAILLETLRWNPPWPSGIPHSADEADIYKGYRIPAGSTIIMNVWGILRDETIYKDPDIFNPDRFIADGIIDPNVLDPREVVFGTGRRICPGRHFAEDMVWITMASILMAFEISNPLDCRDQPINPWDEVLFNSGVISEPVAFKCTIAARDR